MADKDERPEIDSAEALEAWLKDKPAEWAQAIAVRAALRVFPAVFYVSSASNRVSDNELDDFKLAAFRLFLLIYARNLHRNNIEIYHLGEKAERKNKFIIDTFDLNPTKSSALGNRELLKGACGAMQAAAYVCKGLHSRVYETSASVFGSMNALRGAGGVQPDVVWTAVEEDYKYLAKSNSPENLMRQPLWLIDFSEDSRAKFAFERISAAATSFFEQDNKGKGVWRPVSEWYEAVLGDESGSHSYFGEEADRELLSQPNGFWTVSGRRTVEDVLRDIERIRDGKTTVFHAKAASDENDNVSGLAGDEALADGDVLRTDAVPTHLDEPTTDDQLGRRAFAQALVDRIREMRKVSELRKDSEMGELRKSGEGDGFAVHLHAPWGAGKSSIILMMERMLAEPEHNATRWAVVSFNAWKHERRKPPWWPLIETLKDGCISCLDRGHQWHKAEDVRCLWRRWKILAEGPPYVIGLFALAGLLSVLLWGSNDTLKMASGATTMVMGVLSAVIIASRNLYFGSAGGWKLYHDLSRDPMKRIGELFHGIVKTTNEPICIFIDDLDRCNADYVVDLLEGIQTSFRHRDVTYVVAADRAWIRASFEQRYSNFSAHVGNAGQPLGYLFLEKIFQVSTPVPGMGGVKQNYWDGLLTDTFASRADRSSEEAEDENIDRQKKSSEVRAADFDEDVREKRNALREEFRRNIVEEDVSERLKATTSATERAAIVLELTASPAQYRKIEHLLSSYADRLPDNPRVMKRMINTYAMRRAIGYLEGNPVGREVLARWTILEQRFPALADLLIEHPGWADMLAEGVVKDIDMPQALQSFAGDKDVVKVLGAPRSENPLREQDIATITRGSAT